MNRRLCIGPFQSPRGIWWGVVQDFNGRRVVAESPVPFGARVRRVDNLQKTGTAGGSNLVTGCVAITWDDGGGGNSRFVDVEVIQ